MHTVTCTLSHAHFHMHTHTTTRTHPHALSLSLSQLYAENKDKEVDAVHRKRFAQIVKEGPFAKDVVPGVEVATES